MITRVTINNFRKLKNISFSLAQSVVIVGPNNAGKSTIFQAMCLWEIGVKKYVEGIQTGVPGKETSVIINRKDLINTPVVDVKQLWNDGNVANINSPGDEGNVTLAIELEGEMEGEAWRCNAAFGFANNESLTCTVTGNIEVIERMYNVGKGVHFGFLQPMSGISNSEDKLTAGSIDRKLGEGRTAEVLRNICYNILHPETLDIAESNRENNWNRLCTGINALFGAKLQKPEFIRVTGIIQLSYIENGISYDISSAGRGFQQSLLLLAFMYANPNTILLLDEPDAHLEVIRQREIFHLINSVATELNSQIIIASHSEVVLEEAAEASKVIALIKNNIHELNTATSSQKLKYIKKSLTEIGWEKYYLARMTKHVLYLEGSTDLEMLKMFARKLNHKVEPFLKFANVQYTADNVPGTAINNFVALSEIIPGLKGLALFDHLPNLQTNPRLQIICWEKRDLENYFARPAVLLTFAKIISSHFPDTEAADVVKMMQQAVSAATPPIYLADVNNDWWNRTKLSDDWLDIVFAEFYRQLNAPKDFYKRDYYQLIDSMNRNDIDVEVTEKLDIIYEVISHV